MRLIAVAIKQIKWVNIDKYWNYIFKKLQSSGYQRLKSDGLDALGVCDLSQSASGAVVGHIVNAYKEKAWKLYLRFVGVYDVSNNSSTGET